MTRTSSSSYNLLLSTRSSALLFLLVAFWAIGSTQVNAQDGLPTEELPDSVRTKLLEVKERGIAWLLNQRNKEFGWDLGDTPRVVLALASAVKDWPAQHDLEARLTVKQLELELLEKLIRHNVDPLTPGRVSLYALALNGACKDPRNFYGHNLVASLEKHTADQDYPGYPEAFGYSLTAFVSCLSGSHLHRKQVRHLIQITSDIGPSIGSVDTRSMAAMALECFRRKRHNDALARNVGDALKKITQIQQPDGSFGNIHTTTVAIQALATAVEVPGLSWNRTAAAIVLSTMQRPDGSFLDSTHATTEAVIATTTLLNGIGLLNVRRGRCSDFIERPKSTSYQMTDTEHHTETPTAENHGLLQQQPNQSKLNNNGSDVTTTTKTTNVISKSSENLLLAFPETPLASSANINYWIWIGHEPTTAEKYNLTLQVPVNETFFNVMRRAAELSPSFEFSATVWPNGHYVHTISGYREQPVGYHYWLLYKLPTHPDPASPPPTTLVAPAGVDNLLVQDGDTYLFWYKKL